MTRRVNAFGDLFWKIKKFFNFLPSWSQAGLIEQSKENSGNGTIICLFSPLFLTWTYK